MDSVVIPATLAMSAVVASPITNIIVTVIPVALPFDVLPIKVRPIEFIPIKIVWGMRLHIVCHTIAWSVEGQPLPTILLALLYIFDKGAHCFGPLIATPAKHAPL